MVRKLTRLDEKLVPLFDEKNQANIDEMPTFRHCFKMAAGQGQSKTADESRRAVRVLEKLRQEGDVELTDEEFKTLMDRVVLNQPQFITSIHGQLIVQLDELNK